MTDDRIIKILERIAIALEKMVDKETIVNSTFRSSNIQGIKEAETRTGNEQIIHSKDINLILRFLVKRNIQVKNFQTDEETDDVLDNIALFMGNRYNKIKKVYNSIKSRLNLGASFRLDLKNATQEEVSYSCQLCNSLHQIAFLSEYKYFKTPQFIIYAKPNGIPVAINFLQVNG